MASVSFEVPGKPHAKQRPKFARRGRFVTTYTPDETINAETFIRLTAAPHFDAPLSGPVAIEVLAVFQPPASWSGAKTRRMLGSAHLQKPDYDNVIKTVGDALNGIAYADDAQIAEARCRKVWGQVAKTVVTVRTLEDRAALPLLEISVAS